MEETDFDDISVFMQWCLSFHFCLWRTGSEGGFTAPSKYSSYSPFLCWCHAWSKNKSGMQEKKSGWICVMNSLEKRGNFHHHLLRLFLRKRLLFLTSFSYIHTHNYSSSSWQRINWTISSMVGVMVGNSFNLLLYVIPSLSFALATSLSCFPHKIEKWN